MGRPTHRRSIAAEIAEDPQVSSFHTRYAGQSHASLRLGDDTQIRTWDATRLDVSIPRTLDRDTFE